MVKEEKWFLFAVQEIQNIRCNVFEASMLIPMHLLSESRLNDLHLLKNYSTTCNLRCFPLNTLYIKKYCRKEINEEYFAYEVNVESEEEKKALETINTLTHYAKYIKYGYINNANCCFKYEQDQLWLAFCKPQFLDANTVIDAWHNYKIEDGILVVDAKI